MYYRLHASLTSTLASIIWGLPGIAHAQATSEAVIISRPEAGTSNSAYVGGVVWTSEAQAVQAGARISTPIRQRKFIEVYEVPAYEPLTQVSSKAAFKACMSYGACLLDDDSDGRFDRIAEDSVSRAYKLDSPASYERIKVADPEYTVKREIRLLDVNSQTIRLSYRESRASSAEPQSDEVVTFNRRGPGFPITIPVRKVRVIISEATNNSIRYRVENTPE